MPWGSASQSWFQRVTGVRMKEESAGDTRAAIKVTAGSVLAVRSKGDVRDGHRDESRGLQKAG